MNVAALLDPEDVIVAVPDENSILTYVSFLREAFREDKASQAGAGGSDAHAQLLKEKKKYIRAAVDVVHWANTKRSALPPPTSFPPGNVSALKNSLKAHNAFMSGEELALRTEETECLIGEHAELAERLKTSGDETFALLTPSAADIMTAWDEKRYGLLPALRAHQAALEGSIQLAKERMHAFRQKAADLRRWAKGRIRLYSNRTSFPDNWSAIQELKERLEAHETVVLPQKEKNKERVRCLLCFMFILFLFVFVFPNCVSVHDDDVVGCDSDDDVVDKDVIVSVKGNTPELDMHQKETLPICILHHASLLQVASKSSDICKSIYDHLASFSGPA